MENYESKLIVDNLLTDYKNQLSYVMAKHEKMIEKSRTDMLVLIEQSNKELIDLTSKLVGESELEKPKVPVPETAWVKDHLVLNAQAAKNINDIFTLLKDILPEIAEAVKK